MPTEYREIYDILRERLHLADNMLQEQGIDALGTDGVRESMVALLVLYAQRIKALEERVGELQGDVAALELDVGELRDIKRNPDQ